MISIIRCLTPNKDLVVVDNLLIGQSIIVVIIRGREQMVHFLYSDIPKKQKQNKY